MRSELALHIFDTNDPRFMRVMDISAYDSTITPDCERFLVLSPGASSSTYYPVRYGFTELITTVSLYGTEGVGELPDGIYTFRYSINPNDQMWIEYQHLRTTSIIQRYYKAYCALQLDCNLSRVKDERVGELREIRGYIDAAKAAVEYCTAPDKGKQIYDYADSLLKSMEKALGITKKC